MKPQYVHQRVAHRKRKKLKPSRLPTWDDLDNAIDALGALFKDLSLLITGSSATDLLPTWQGDDWEWVFRQPWAVESAQGEA